MGPRIFGVFDDEIQYGFKRLITECLVMHRTRRNRREGGPANVEFCRFDPTLRQDKRVRSATDQICAQVMQMKDGYTDGHHGAWLIDPPVFDSMFQTYWDAGYQIHIHNNGDAGLEVLLAALEKAQSRQPRKDHRTVLVHFGFAKSPQVKRWIELGGIVSSNPYYVTALSGRYARLGIGPARAVNMVPHGDVLDSGGSLSFHSDMPMAPAKPLQLIWSAVNRRTEEGPVSGPRHRVPLDIALRAVTINAAYSLRLAKRLGSIEVG